MIKNYKNDKQTSDGDHTPPIGILDLWQVLQIYAFLLVNRPTHLESLKIFNKWHSKSIELLYKLNERKLIVANR